MIRKVHLGDVFLIPIDNSRYGIGQIAGDWNGELYLVIFDAVYADENVNPNGVVSATPLFAALSLDAKLYNGDWRVIGNVTHNLSFIRQPVFKVNQGSEVFLESRDRSITRRASSKEQENLRFRTVVAPVRLEKALRAHNGMGEWNTRFEDLRYDYAFNSSQYITD